MKFLIILLLFSSLLFPQVNSSTLKGMKGAAFSNSYTQRVEKIGSFTFNYQQPTDQILGGTNVIDIQADQVKSFATVTEESDPNMGRIWAIYCSNNHATPDSIDKMYIYSSDDNGATWNFLGAGNLGSGMFFYPNMLDAAIISDPTDTSNHKTLFVTYTYSLGNYLSGMKKVGLLCIDLKNFSGGLFGVNIPGDQDNQYYNLRITTDNQQYPSDPWMYMVCTIDSTFQSGDVICMQRIARILSPYDFLNNQEITYRADILQQYLTVGTAAPLMGKSDITYINGSDELVYYTLSHPNSDGIYINNTDINGSNTSTQIYHIDIGVEITDHEMASAFNSDSAQIMLLSTRYLSSGYKDIVSYKLDMNNAASSQYKAIMGGFAGEIPRHPDIVSPRGTVDDYRVSFVLNDYGNPSHADSVVFMESVKAGGNNWTSPQRVSMGSGNAFFSKYSRVGVKLNGSDNTFVLWSDALTESGYIGQDFLCTYGAGIPTGIITATNTPYEFSLSQNYPNPFNPTTMINYTIPEKGNVLIKVYDILGNEISTLVNGEKPAGQYSVQFNSAGLSSGIYFYTITSGDYVQTKKMVLLK